MSCVCWIFTQYIYFKGNIDFKVCLYLVTRTKPYQKFRGIEIFFLSKWRYFMRAGWAGTALRNISLVCLICGDWCGLCWEIHQKSIRCPPSSQLVRRLMSVCNVADHTSPTVVSKEVTSITRQINSRIKMRKNWFDPYFILVNGLFQYWNPPWFNIFRRPGKSCSTNNVVNDSFADSPFLKYLNGAVNPKQFEMVLPVIT